MLLNTLLRQDLPGGAVSITRGKSYVASVSRAAETGRALPIYTGGLSKGEVLAYIRERGYDVVFDDVMISENVWGHGASPSTFVREQEIKALPRGVGLLRLGIEVKEVRTEYDAHGRERKRIIYYIAGSIHVLVRSNDYFLLFDNDGNRVYGDRFKWPNTAISYGGSGGHASMTQEMYEWCVANQARGTTDVSVNLPRGTTLRASPDVTILDVPTNELRAIGVTCEYSTLRLLLYSRARSVGAAETYASTMGRNYANVRKRQCKDSDWGSKPLKPGSSYTNDSVPTLTSKVFGLCVNDATFDAPKSRVGLEEIDGAGGKQRIVIIDEALDGTTEELTPDEYEMGVRGGMLESNASVNAYFGLGHVESDGSIEHFGGSGTMDNPDTAYYVVMSHVEPVHHKLVVVIAQLLNEMLVTGKSLTEVGKEYVARGTKIDPEADVTSIL